MVCIDLLSLKGLGGGAGSKHVGRSHAGIVARAASIETAIVRGARVRRPGNGMLAESQTHTSFFSVLLALRAWMMVQQPSSLKLLKLRLLRGGRQE
jgi:hypothetical protein